MTTLAEVDRSAVLRRAAVRATRAPSVHNTQPWRFRLRRDELLLYADRTRQLSVLDPGGRQLTVSCGCALLNARISIAASGLTARVDRLPDPHQPDLLARIVTVDRSAGSLDELAALDQFIDVRHTNRRRFADEQLPADALEALVGAAGTEGAELFVVSSEEHRLAVAVLNQRADAIENADPAYRAEIRAWTTEDLNRVDGVSASTVAHVDGSSLDEVPLRDFDTHGIGSLPAETASSHRQSMVVLATARDQPVDWLCAGEALERVLLEITRRGFVASPLTQVIEVPVTRASLRTELGLIAYPQILLRVGRAPLAPASRRRRLVDVLAEDG